MFDVNPLATKFYLQDLEREVLGGKQAPHFQKAFRPRGVAKVISSVLLWPLLNKLLSN